MLHLLLLSINISVDVIVSVGGNIPQIGAKLSIVGGPDGDAVGMAPGAELGLQLFLNVGLEVGSILGVALRLELGEELGLELGKEFGIEVGAVLGDSLGLELGKVLGAELWKYDPLGTNNCGFCGSIFLNVAVACFITAGIFRQARTGCKNLRRTLARVFAGAATSCRGESRFGSPT